MVCRKRIKERIILHQVIKADDRYVLRYPEPSLCQFSRQDKRTVVAGADKCRRQLLRQPDLPFSVTGISVFKDPFFSDPDSFRGMRFPVAEISVIDRSSQRPAPYETDLSVPCIHEIFCHPIHSVIIIRHCRVRFDAIVHAVKKNDRDMNFLPKQFHILFTEAADQKDCVIFHLENA